MSNNRYYPEIRKSRRSASIYKLHLQSAVAAFISDYTTFLFLYGHSPLHYLSKKSHFDSVIHLGMSEQESIRWCISYLDLDIDKNLKLHFFIGTSYDYEDCPEKYDNIFKCTFWNDGEYLNFDLASKKGLPLKSFQLERKSFELERDVTLGMFYPVIREIQWITQAADEIMQHPDIVCQSE